MSKYKNLPGFGIELLDGNLRVDDSIKGPVELVIGTAISGPSNTPFLVTDTNVASLVFGSSSPLIEKMSQAAQGGAKNIVLYRIGGAASEIRNLFGADTLIATEDETVLSNTKFSVFIGDSPAGGGETVLIVFDGDEIVFSNVPGGEIDLGEISVTGFDATFPHTVGTPTSPVPFNSVISSLSSPLNDTLISVGSATFELSSAGVHSDSLSVTVDGVAQVSGTNFTMVDNVTPSDDEIVFTSVAREEATLSGDGTTTSFDLPEGGTNTSAVTVDGVVQVVTTDYSISVGTGTSGVDEIVFVSAPGAGASNISVTYTIAAPLTSETVIVTGTATPTIPGVTYSAGADNLSASWQKKYELLDAAYIDLETTIADVVHVDAAMLDAPNLADGDTSTDRLTYFSKSESSTGTVYTWSDTKIIYKLGAGTTADGTLADTDANGQPIVSERFNEVNFVHQFGTWAQSVTENDRFVLGSLGTSAPSSNSRYAVSTWLGTLPKTNALGVIIANGTGLLGNRFMSGGVGVSPGFFATDSGFPDGKIQYDTGGAPIDLGKFISIVASQVITADGQVNAAGIYAGMITVLEPGTSTTNRAVRNVSLPFAIKKNKLDELAFAGYVAFTQKTRAVAVVSGELPTADGSDYQYVSTPIIIKGLVEGIRDVSDPYIGGGVTDISLSAMETAIEGIFSKAARDGWITKYQFSLVSTPAMRVRGLVNLQMTTVPVFELRNISSSLKLAADL